MAKNNNDNKAAEPPPGKKGFFSGRRIWRAARASACGVLGAWRTETAFRQEVCIVVLLVPAAFWADVSGGERALMIFSLLLVLVAELLNTAVEAAADWTSEGRQRNRHPLAAKAKDAASAAVLFAIIAAATVWTVILFQK